MKVNNLYGTTKIDDLSYAPQIYHSSECCLLAEDEEKFDKFLYLAKLGDGQEILMFRKRSMRFFITKEQWKCSLTKKQIEQTDDPVYTTS